MKLGRAVVVARNARPVEIALTPWWKRPDGPEIAAAKRETEERIRQLAREKPADTRIRDYIRSHARPTKSLVLPGVDSPLADHPSQPIPPLG